VSSYGLEKHMQPACRVGPQPHLGDAAQTQLLGNLEPTNRRFTSHWKFSSIGTANSLPVQTSYCSWLKMLWQCLA
jgi:hypothetical protein